DTGRHVLRSADRRRRRHRDRRDGSTHAEGKRMKPTLALVLMFCAACGGGSQPAPGATAAPGTPGAPGPKTLRFAVIPKALDIAVFNYAKIGAERAAKSLGNVQVLWNAPPNADQLKQKEILESYITQRVDGIAISALNGDFLTDTINKAIDAGIPVTTWDSDA